MEEDQKCMQNIQFNQFIPVAISNKASQVVYISKHRESSSSSAQLNLPKLHPQKDSLFQRISRLKKYSIDLFASVFRQDQDFRISKFHVLDVKFEEEVYKDEPLRYLQAYQAITAFNLKNILDYKQEDYQFRQEIINYVQTIEQDFKKQYSKQDKSSLQDQQLKIYLQNCPQNTLLQCLQRFKVFNNKVQKNPQGQQPSNVDKIVQEKESTRVTNE